MKFNKLFLLLLSAIIFFALPAFGAEDPLDLTVQKTCAAKYAAPELPPIILNSIEIFQTYSPKPEIKPEVVYITNMDGMLDCYGYKSQANRQLAKSKAGMAIDNQFPIYINGELPILKEVNQPFRGEGSTHALSYVMATIIGHEWKHATGEKLESKAMEFELQLLQKFWSKIATNISLKASVSVYMDKIRKGIKSEQAFEEEAKTLVVPTTANK